MRYFSLVVFLSAFISLGCVNIDSMYANRYSKTLADSVFAVGDKIRCPNVEFDYSKTSVLASSRDSIQAVADFLMRNPFLLVQLEYHCDLRGTPDYNQKLSLLRADAAVKYLLENFGNDTLWSDRIVAVGKGERDPIFTETFIAQAIQKYGCSTNELDQMHRFNQRLELKVVGFIHPNFYQRRALEEKITIDNFRNPAYYEDLILIADKALLEGDLKKALEFYQYAADLAPADEPYALDQYKKIKILIGQ